MVKVTISNEEPEPSEEEIEGMMEATTVVSPEEMGRIMMDSDKEMEIVIPEYLLPKLKELGITTDELVSMILGKAKN